MDLKPVYKIKQLVVEHGFDWDVWPDTDNVDYEKILNISKLDRFDFDDKIIEVESKYYPVCSAWISAGVYSMHVPHPQLKNNIYPPWLVMDRIAKDIIKLGKDCHILFWPHTRHCFRPTMEKVAPHFNFKFFSFADDIRGSSEEKTFPVANLYDAGLCCMSIWDPEDGTTVETKYKENGLDKIYFGPVTESVGLQKAIDERAWCIENKISAAQNDLVPIDLIFIGGVYSGWGNKWRGPFLKALDAHQDGSLNIEVWGHYAKRGILAGQQDVTNCGYNCALKYFDSLCGVNPHMSGIFNTRLLDLWKCGVIQFIWNQWNELEPRGIVADRDYVAFDGTLHDLLGKVKKLKRDKDRCLELIQNGLRAAEHVHQNYGWNAIYGKLYNENLTQILK